MLRVGADLIEGLGAKEIHLAARVGKAAILTGFGDGFVSLLLPLYLLGISSFGWPLLAAGALKIVYDLLLLLMFRKLRPPEEERVR